MTNDEIDAMPAGKELDVLVAKAIGCVYAGYVMRGPVYKDSDNHHYQCGVQFKPSFDWNNAMWAAEKCGLFGVNHLCKEGDEWVVGEMDAMIDDFRRIGVAPTGPLAIARAIAKLGVAK